MKKPRISTVIITIQFVAIVLCLGFLGRALYQNWFLKHDAKMLSNELGFQRARADFVRGKRNLYEIKTFTYKTDGTFIIDDTSAPTGRHDGPYEIRVLLTSDDYPSVHKEIRQVLVDAYNQHMHQLYEKPEWFDANGFRVLHSSTNSKNGLPAR